MRALPRLHTQLRKLTYARYAGSRLRTGTPTAHEKHRLMLLGSPPDMVHRAPAHGAHIRMQNSAIYSPVRFKYYTIPFGKLQVAVGGWGRKFLLKRFE